MLKSRGVINPALQHQVYRRTHRAIHRAINHILAKRLISACVASLCQEANITGPTFYAHYSNLELARKEYEDEILYDFVIKLPNRTNHEVIFTLLLSGIRQHRSYFCATARNQDFFLLCKTIDISRQALVGSTINDRNYSFYRHQLVTLIAVWIEADKAAAEAIPYYAHELTKVRVQMAPKMPRERVWN